MGKKPIVSVTYENERISIKKQLTLHKMCHISPMWLINLYIERKPFTVQLIKRPQRNRPMDHTQERRRFNRASQTETDNLKIFSDNRLTKKYPICLL